jgi:hypothetical protein
MRVYENHVGTVPVVRTVLVLLQGLHSTGPDQTSMLLQKPKDRKYQKIKAKSKKLERRGGTPI